MENSGNSSKLEWSLNIRFLSFALNLRGKNRKRKKERERERERERDRCEE